MIASLKEDSGLMAVALPQGALYRGAAEASIRQRLIEDNLLDTVIVLPEKLLRNTNIPLAILVFKKGKVDKNILFIDASQEFEAGQNTNTLASKHIAKIIDAYRRRESIDKYTKLATLSDIHENNFNCNIPRYVDRTEIEKPVELSRLNSKRQLLLKELEVVSTSIDQYTAMLQSD